MFKQITVAISVLSLSACVPTSGLQALDPKSADGKSDPNTFAKYYSGSGDTSDFNDLILAIRKDEIYASSAGNEMDIAEQAFGLATVGAAIFGGYTSTFTGAKDIPEAAFFAASLLGIRGYVNADENKEAARRAGRRLNCLVRESRPFSDPSFDGFDGLAEKTSYNDIYDHIDLNKNQKHQGFVGAVGSFDEHSALLSKIHTNEKRAYRDRFVIVIDVYRSIVRSWEAESGAQYQAYDTLLASITEATKKEVEQEQELENLGDAAAGLTGSEKAILDDTLENADRYTKAKSAVLKCALAD
ncbi:hypothetical protein [Ponticaulis profundi]|uniref:Lipoprotein n=1 Tax=Ponticaulis profundi TaxID=2665222 RepID=A0ABW1SB78_9PROT